MFSMTEHAPALRLRADARALETRRVSSQARSALEFRVTPDLGAVVGSHVFETGGVLIEDKA